MHKKPKEVRSSTGAGLPNGQNQPEGLDLEFEVLRAAALPVPDALLKRITDLLGDAEVRLAEPLKPEDD